MSSATAPPPGLALRDRVHTWLRRLESPAASYMSLVLITGTLVALGLVMVLSASAYYAQRSTGSSYSLFVKQLVFAVIGGLGMLVASRLPVRSWKALAYPVLGIGAALQLAVLLFTDARLGNKNWITLGPVTVQPSELIKIGLILVGACVLARKQPLLHRFAHVMVPYVVPVSIVSIGLVLAGHDVGTGIILGAIVATLLFTAGVSLRIFGLGIGAAALTLAVAVATSPNRLRRLDVWMGKDQDINGAARQPIHGRFALADGGWLGRGLGNSQEKWGHLSEPQNDFIFAVIGEELGLLGTLFVLALYVALALVCLRMVRRTDDMFVRLATAGIMGWLILQAIINIGAVIGFLPVIGVPLPLVSAGGSSLVTTMVAMGILMSFARREPGALEVIKARPSAAKRTLAVLPASVRRRSGATSTLTRRSTR